MCSIGIMELQKKICAYWYAWYMAELNEHAKNNVRIAILGAKQNILERFCVCLSVNAFSFPSKPRNKNNDLKTSLSSGQGRPTSAVLDLDEFKVIKCAEACSEEKERSGTS